jgi:beta-lactamase class A
VGGVQAADKAAERPKPVASVKLKALPPPAPTLPTTKTPPANDPSRGRPGAGLSDALFNLWKAFPGKTGIAVQRIDGNWTLAHRGGDLFPQQSVSKLWVTMTILDLVDSGALRLSDTVRIGPEDLTLFHQPIAARVRASGEVRETIGSLIDQAITKSDNSANDALLRRAGGPEAVRAFIARRNLGAIRFGPGERLLQSRTAGLTWDQSYSVGRAFQEARAKLTPEARKAALDAYLANPVDGASPQAIALALARLKRGELLSRESTAYLLDVLSRTTSGPQRLKGGLPADWTIGHKTGTGQELAPVSTGFNDIAIITAPDGGQYAVVVMLSHTTAPIKSRFDLMQGVSKAIVAAHGK